MIANSLSSCSSSGEAIPSHHIPLCSYSLHCKAVGSGSAPGWHCGSHHHLPVGRKGNTVLPTASCCREVMVSRGIFWPSRSGASGVQSRGAFTLKPDHGCCLHLSSLPWSSHETLAHPEKAKTSLTLWAQSAGC